MAYTPKTWVTDEVITATELNAIEQGVQASAAAADTANTGLTSKVNSSTYTAGLAGKADYPTGGTDGQALVKSGSTTAWATVSGGTTPDATSTTKGAVQLAGDLAGTAAAPTVPGLAAKANTASLATVATSGSYTDLTNKPTIPAAYTDEQAQDAVAAAFAAGTQTGVTVAYNDAANSLSITATGTTSPNATTTSPGLVQLAGDLAGTATSPTVPGLAGKLSAANNLSDVATPATARTNLGLGSAATQPSSAFDASGAAAAAQATAVQRANHTGTQPATTITGLATVATSGSYTDLSGKPAIPTVGAAGAGAAVALSSTDASVTNARTPTAHASSHATGGTDVLTPAAIGAAPFPAGGTDGQVLAKSGSSATWTTVSGGGNAKLDLATSTYNFGPSSLRWARAAAARARSGGNTFHVAAIGDSTTVGSNLTTFAALWTQVLSAQIASHGGTIRGTGMLAPDVATHATGPATTTGSGLQAYTAGIAASAAYLPTGATLTFTATTDQFRVMYQKRATSGGTIAATVDGSAVASIDTSNTGGTGVFFQTYDVTQGSHTLVLTGPASGNGFLLGVEARSGGATGGTKLSVFARGGKTSTDLADSTSEGNGSSIQAITALAADLLIIDIGINDYTTQVPLATYKSNIQAAITAQRAVKGDVLLVGWPPNSAAQSIPQASYIQQLYDICDANDVALIDFQARWGSFAIASSAPMSYYPSDGTHPSSAGHADMANAFYSALATAGIGV